MSEPLSMVDSKSNRLAQRLRNRASINIPNSCRSPPLHFLSIAVLFAWLRPHSAPVMSSRDPASALPRAAQDKDESKQEDQLIESTPGPALLNFTMVPHANIHVGALPSGGTAFSLADEATSGGQPITGFSVARVPIAVLNQLSEQSSMLQELQQHVKNQENTIAAMKRSVRTFSHER